MPAADAELQVVAHLAVALAGDLDRCPRLDVERGEGIMLEDAAPLILQGTTPNRRG